eukprot:10139285-Alexandrium_andersonii.AAC.1
MTGPLAGSRPGSDPPGEPGEGGLLAAAGGDEASCVGRPSVGGGTTTSRKMTRSATREPISDRRHAFS